MSYIYFHTTINKSAPQGSSDEKSVNIAILVTGALALGGFVIGILYCTSKYFFLAQRLHFFLGLGVFCVKVIAQLFIFEPYEIYNNSKIFSKI